MKEVTLTLDGILLDGDNDLNGVNEIRIKWVNKTASTASRLFPIEELLENFSIKEDTGWEKHNGVLQKITRYKRD